ncbi:hypothetical protein EAH69_08055 [Faecalibacter macacae]|uniref:Uncharacterized protein n=1 Tax=Faecalibacter macacae TaxID=1859289 RepID=A0A3L9MA87_9FLAO|nr:hypothetical protein EAH69_08055 [Faecalibacter macacae]
MSEANIKILKQCLNCGNMFEAHKTTTKYCTHKCNSQHYKLRKRLEQKSEIEQAPILNTKFKSVTKQLPSWLNDYNTNDKKIEHI